MSNISKGFHTICTGFDCDPDNRYDEGDHIELDIVTSYIKHKESLKKNLKSKLKANAKLLSDSVMDDESNVGNVLSSTDVSTVSVDVPSACFDFSEIERRLNSKLFEVKDELSDYFHFFFFFFFFFLFL